MAWFLGPGPIAPLLLDSLAMNLKRVCSILVHLQGTALGPRLDFTSLKCRGSSNFGAPCGVYSIHIHQAIKHVMQHCLEISGAHPESQIASNNRPLDLKVTQNGDPRQKRLAASPLVPLRVTIYKHSCEELPGAVGTRLGGGPLIN